jgi:hypothetical protein
MAAGKASLLDWDLFTSSFGCRGFLDPRASPAFELA